MPALHSRKPSVRALTVDEVWKEVIANIGLCHKIARRYRGCGLSRDDLVQEGTLGLKRAVELFDPAHKVKFSTYATRAIRSAIGMAIEKQGLTIRVPRWTKQAEPGSEFARDAARAHRTTLLGAYLPPDEESVYSLHRYRNEHDFDDVQVAMEVLNDRERAVIHDRFYGGLLFYQIGQKLGVSDKRIQQIERRAIKKLRQQLRETA